MQFLAHELALQHKHNECASLIVNWPNRLGGTLLHEAIQNQDVSGSSIGKIIDLTLAPDKKIINDITPLHLAVRRKDNKIVQFLLNKKVPITSFTTLFDQSPLGVAVEENLYEIAEMLLRNGAQINNDGHKEFLLHKACKSRFISLIELLMSYKADVNQPDARDDTPLLICVKNNLVEPAKILLATNKVDVNIPDCEGTYPIHYACAQGNRVLVKMLLQHNAKNLEDTQGKRALSYISPTNISLAKIVKKHFSLSIDYFIQAVQTLNWLVVIACLRNGFTEDDLPRQNKGLMYKAIMDKDDRIVQFLLDYHVDCNRKNQEGYSPLQAAVHYGCINIIKLLLNNGAQINSPDTFNCSSLFNLAVDAVSILDVLLKNNADINQRNNAGLTPFLFYVAHNNLLISKLFLESSIGNNVINQSVIAKSAYNGNTALHYACVNDNPEMIELLINHGIAYAKNNSGYYPYFLTNPYNSPVVDALMRSKSKDGNTLLHQAIINNSSLLDHMVNLLDKSNCNIQNYAGNTPLHLAVIFQRAAIAEWLIEYKYTKLSIENMAGQTALECACILENQRLIEALLKARAPVDAVNAADETPLFNAVLRNHGYVARALLRFGANINHKSSDGSKILHKACQQNNRQAVVFLLDQPGIEVNIFDHEGNCPLRLTTDETICELLIKQGALPFFNYKGHHCSLIDAKKNA